jgi:hypothetical protein
MKRILAAILSLIIALSVLTSCERRVDPEKILRDFCTAYGIEAAIYSSGAKEGENGFADAEFLPTLLTGRTDEICDFAVAFCSTLDGYFEVGILACKTAYGANEVSLACLERIELVKVICNQSDITVSEGAFVARYGNSVVYSMATDNERARRLLDAHFSGM